MEDLKINNDREVSPVGKDTKLIAKCVAKLKFKTAIDIGTGTGYIPIYLKNQPCHTGSFIYLTTLMP